MNRKKSLMMAALLVVLSTSSVALAQDAGSAVDQAVTTDATLTTDASKNDAAPAVAPPTVPESADDAIDSVKDAIQAAKDGKWWHLSSIVVLLLVWGLKKFQVMAKLGRWKFVVTPVLSLAAALLATFQGGVSMAGAMGVFTSSWSMGMLEELWNHGILGKPRASATTTEQPPTQ